eukprot:scaffold127152_cov16-Prasinocladus_malaysianus.AAC.2
MGRNMVTKLRASCRRRCSTPLGSARAPVRNEIRGAPCLLRVARDGVFWAWPWRTACRPCGSACSKTGTRSEIGSPRGMP